MRINTQSHWPPRVGDAVVRPDRIREGKRHDGKITIIDKDMEEVIVQFNGHKVVFVLDCFAWQGHTCYASHYRVDGIRYPAVVAILCPDMLQTDGSTDSFSFDEMKGNWSTLEQAWWLG